MGTKKAIGPIVAEIAKSSRQGSFLDLFCGVGCVAQNIGTERVIWANDAQKFAFSLAKAMFTSSQGLFEAMHAPEMFKLFKANKATLTDKLDDLVHQEEATLDSMNVETISNFYKIIPNVETSQLSEEERRRNSNNIHAHPFSLFTICYPGTYLGLSQCIEVDSLRYAISLLNRQNVINDECQNWFILALCKAISNCSTTTGHFAQFLNPNTNNIKYYINKRRKSVLTEMHSIIPNCIPIGTSVWRENNKVFNRDALFLLDQLIEHGEAPAVVYADPPYTEDQYSRFYHLYETLIAYDYPEVQHKAKYRKDRFRSSFSLKSIAGSKIEELIKKCSFLGSDLLLSYPQNGLLGNSLESIPGLVGKYYNRSEVVKVISHSHSSFGASNSKSKSEILEIIFRGYN